MPDAYDSWIGGPNPAVPLVRVLIQAPADQAFGTMKYASPTASPPRPPFVPSTASPPSPPRNVHIPLDPRKGVTYAEMIPAAVPPGPPVRPPRPPAPPLRSWIQDHVTKVALKLKSPNVNAPVAFPPYPPTEPLPPGPPTTDRMPFPLRVADPATAVIATPVAGPHRPPPPPPPPPGRPGAPRGPPPAF